MITYKNDIVQEDLALLLENQTINWQKLEGKTVLITGANSMLATYMIYAIKALNDKKNRQTKVVATVRNVAKAKERFADLLGDSLFELLAHDVSEPFEY